MAPSGGGDLPCQGRSNATSRGFRRCADQPSVHGTAFAAPAVCMHSTSRPIPAVLVINSVRRFANRGRTVSPRYLGFARFPIPARRQRCRCRPGRDPTPATCQCSYIKCACCMNATISPLIRRCVQHREDAVMVSRRHRFEEFNDIAAGAESPHNGVPSLVRPERPSTKSNATATPSLSIAKQADRSPYRQYPDRSAGFAPDGGRRKRVHNGSITFSTTG